MSDADSTTRSEAAGRFTDIAADVGVSDTELPIGHGVGFDADDPSFAEPWQAEAFALTVQLHAQGAFTWAEWSAALGAEVATSSQQGLDDYFHCWLRALECLVLRKGLLSEDAIASTAEAWGQAYRNTPHGQPVSLPGRTGIP